MTNSQVLAPRLATLFVAIVASAAFASAAMAGPIERACYKSDRKAASRALCDCIQKAADNTLSNGDQRRAVAFFKDPDKAHDVWMSQNDRDDAFWERYKAFGARAEAMCGGATG